MADFREVLISAGAVLAADGIPLHFGDPNAEYEAALNQAVLMNRSHEARVEIVGKSRLDLLHRISTNDLTLMADGEGRATIFTTAAARILDRVIVYACGERALLLGEPGRATPLAHYLQRNIFFNDDARLTDLTASTFAFDLHGPLARPIAEMIIPTAAKTSFSYFCVETEVAGTQIVAARRTALSGSRWTLVGPLEKAAQIWNFLVDRGKNFALRPAGSLTYNTLRIRAAVPGVGHELSQDYIPLEVGLWNEVSFSKGCYTGQEIIARMESRGRLANTLVTLDIDSFVEAPATLYHDGRTAGIMTSSTQAPGGEIFAVGVIKVALAQPGQLLTMGEKNIAARVGALAGAQPPQLIAGAQP